MPQVIGSRDTENILQVKRIIDMKDTIDLLQPSAVPLTVLTNRINGRRIVSNPKFNWLSGGIKDYVSQIDNGAGYQVGDTVLKVDANTETIFTPNDIVFNENTKEPMRVVSVDTAAHTITVVRNYRDTGAAVAIADNNYLRIVGNAYAEFATSQLESSSKDVEYSNYTQIYRTAFGASETLKASKLYGGKDLDSTRKKKGIEHALKIEQSAFFGHKKLDTSGDKPRRTTGGLIEFLTENLKDVGGALNEEIFNEWLQLVFRFGSAKRTLFASPLLVGIISGWAKGKLQIQMNETAYGIAIGKYISPSGNILNIIEHKEVLRNQYAAYGFALALEDIRYAPLEGRDTKLKTNIQANDADGEMDEFKTEAGWEIREAKKHGYICNFT